MNLKEIVTHPDVNKYIAKIELYLVDIGATHIRKEYKNKECVGIGFSVFNVQKMMHVPYLLTTQVDKCYQNIYEEQYKLSPERLDQLKQLSVRLAWKLLADLVEMKTKLIVTGIVCPMEAFLPYCLAQEDPPVTLIQKIRSNTIQWK
jgi:hydrogenase-4 membrane subunit HyfE